MFKNYYNLDSQPFRLTPDPRFAFAHHRYQKAREYMRYALEQGDGFLVITGRSGTGKTTLAEDLLTGLSPGKVNAATLAFTRLEVDDLLRKVAYAFNVNAKGSDKATLLLELEKYLAKHSRSLLIIDEAHNLSAEALEEVSMLTKLHVGSQPLLQIFLLGQKELRKWLYTPEMEHLHQWLLVACDLEALSLSETREYVLHRLNCAGWRGNPEISAAAFVMIHRFSEGLPRNINKLCTRLFLHGAEEQRHLLDLDDVLTAIREMQEEMLLPVALEKAAEESGSLPDIQALISSSSIPVDWFKYLAIDEQAFIKRCSEQKQPVPIAPSEFATLGERPDESVPELAAERVEQKRSLGDRSGSGLMAVVTQQGHCEKPIRWKWRWTAVPKRKLLDWRRHRAPIPRREIFGYGLAVSVALVCVYVLGMQYTTQQQLSIGSGMVATGAEERASVRADPAGTRPGVKSDAPNNKVAESSRLVETRQADNKNSSVDSFTETENEGKALVLAEGPETQTVQEEATTAIGGETELISSMGRSETLESAEVIAVSLMNNEHLLSASYVPDSDKSMGTSTRKMRNIFDSDLFEPTEVLEPAVSKASQAMDINEVSNMVHSSGDGQEPPVMKSIPPDSPPLTESESADRHAQSTDATENTQIKKLLLLAKQALAKDRLRLPAKRSGWYYYSQVLKLDPGNQNARRGLKQIAARYGDLAGGLIEKQQYDKAQLFINRGLGVVPGHDRLLALQQQMLALQGQEARLSGETETRATLVEPEPEGFLGSLKKFFADSEVQSLEQLFEASDY